jgi:type I restriction enzyme, R subunit
MITPPSFREDAASQIPALQLLMKLGYSYLSPEEALEGRGGKTTGVLLEGILRRQLKEINSIRVSSTKSSVFSEGNIEAGIQALKDLPFQDGYMAASQAAYERLTLGKALEQNIDGDKKSFTLQYIDWKNPSNNVFHVTEEYAVMRTGSREHFRPDVVLFINGIPLCIIECKRPDMKEPLSQAISQHIRNQMEDGIRSLYVYSQVLLGTACLQAKYATTDTKEEFWAAWKEDELMQKVKGKTQKEALAELVNTPLNPEQKDKLYRERTQWERAEMEAREGQTLGVSVQDEYIYNLCRPQRLLELIKDYIIFEGGIYKKIARYQQYFTIEHIAERIQQMDEGRRKGGVVWHTQGNRAVARALLWLCLPGGYTRTCLMPRSYW